MKNIVIFASGEGTNALNIIRYFKGSEKARVALIVSNRGAAPVLSKAALEGVPLMILDKKEYFEAPEFSEFLQKMNTDLIVLAGFLWLLPARLVKAFPDKIVNIHPALLPKYGGKGMYGLRVHEAVIGNKEKESGISIHYVNEHFDEGAVVFQAKCSVNPGETPASLAAKVHLLEHEHFPKVIEQILHLS